MKQTLLKTLKVLLLSASMVTLAPLGSANTEISSMVETSGLSGSFLASRVALEDSDDAAAVEFLRRALALDPD